MVDLRKLFNELVECCEKEIEIKESDVGNIFPIDFIEDLRKNIEDLKDGIDDFESDIKEKVKEAESLKDGLETIAELLY